MRRKESNLIPSANRGRSLISTRIQQHQQRKMQNVKSQLPRSYSTPAQSEVESKGYVMRSFSSPDPKQVCYRRNSDSFCRPKPECSKTELDSDLDNYELFEESFIDMDAEPDDMTFGAYTKNPEIDEPKKVVAALLPGSGLQRISLKPISPRTIQKIKNSRQRKHQKDNDDNPAETEHSSLIIDELQRSPAVEIEALELEREFRNAEQHLDAEIALATEESDSETKLLDSADITDLRQICRFQDRDIRAYVIFTMIAYYINIIM